MNSDVIYGQMLHQSTDRGFEEVNLMPGPCSNLDDCDLSIGTLGYMKSINGFSWSQTAPSISLHFVTAGSGSVQHHTHHYPANAGDAFCFFTDETYHYHDTAQDYWQYTWLSINGYRANTVLHELGFSIENPVVQNFPMKAVRNVLTEIDSAFRGEDHSLYFPQSAAWRLMDRLHVRQQQTASDQLAHVLRRILDETYTRMDLSIQHIAQELGVDRSTLFRRFQKMYNMAPKTYLENKRMHHAQALIRSQHLSIKDTAKHCGYEDPQYFSRVFKKHFGVAPSQYS
ncbi:MAG: helix-turn-helix transcriptional regulator [Planctomycetes bacterium]|nr:helix-turn-helix transcriptional regulator [Planctomycetota bacterium]